MIFKDRTVILTGGSAGVGAAAARLFADAGANLMLVARSKKNLEAIADPLREKTEVRTLAMDVADADACADLVKKTNFEFGGIDILVNNAGAHHRGNLESVEAADLARMIDVNLRAPIVLIRLVLPYLRDAGGGAIVNVGSLAGRTPVPGSAVYAAGKAGLRSLTYSLADELIGSGIKVAVVSPGPIDTGFIMNDIDRVSDLTFSQPLSSAEAVAQAILDLCGNRQTEQSMPAVSGVLTAVTYLMPWAGRLARPALERRGAAVKRRLKAEARKAAAAVKEKAARQGE